MRRIHLPALHTGDISADTTQSHHLRTVLRVAVGEQIEAFDDAGRTTVAQVIATEPLVTLRVETIAATPALPQIVVASAVPKGDRADWMVEKLSEVGVARFVPLRTARSVVHPDGRSKTERWQRIAVESAKQCRRPGVLTIDPLTDLRTLLPTIKQGTGFYCSTNPTAPALPSQISNLKSPILLIGPEGDWTADEEAAFAKAALTPISLGPTIMRVETAAVLAVGMAMLLASSQKTD